MRRLFIVLLLLAIAVPVYAQAKPEVRAKELSAELRAKVDRSILLVQNVQLQGQLQINSIPQVQEIQKQVNAALVQLNQERQSLWTECIKALGGDPTKDGFDPEKYALIPGALEKAKKPQ